MRRKRIFTALIICALALLAACGSSNETYPEIKAADIESMELSKLKNSAISFSYPSGEWSGQPNSDPLSILWADNMNNSDKIVNIQTSVVDNWSGKLTQKDLDAFQAEYINAYGGEIDISKAEMRSLNGNPIIYFEWTQSITEERIQAMLDSGEWTEEWLEMNGGYEAFLNMEPTDMVVVMGIVDEHLVCYIGSYYHEESKGDIVEAITVLYQTSEIVQ